MSWDERYTDVRAELRAAQREADALVEGGVEGRDAERQRAGLRKTLHEAELVIRGLVAEAEREKVMDVKHDMLRRVDLVKEQRKAIVDKLGERKEGFLSGVKKSLGLDRARQDVDDEPMFDEHDDDVLLTMQDEGIQEQNDKLARLHNVIVRQKEIGQAIGQELDSHNEILDRLEEGVEQSTRAVRQENRRIHGLLDSSSSDSRLTICICVLLLALLLVVILALQT